MKSLKEIIMEELPKERIEDFLVIYDDNITSDEWLANGYLEAGNNLIDKLLAEGIYASNDVLIIPVIYNYLHSLELCLKIYLKKLIEHKRCDYCSSIEISIDKDVSSYSHKLGSIVDTILKAVDNDGIHSNKDFVKVKTLIETLNELGMNNESLRYLEVRRDFNKIYKKQKWVKIKDLRDVFNYCYELIITRSFSDDLKLCKYKMIEQKSIDELVKISSMLNELSTMIPPEPIVESVIDFNNIWEIIEGSANEVYIEDQLSKRLEQFNDEDLALINKGLRFVKSSVVDVPDVSQILSWGRDEMIRKFIEDYNFITEAQKKINEHIIFIESMLNKKINK